MEPNPVAKTVADIAERERKLAVKEGDYIWAILCAVVEVKARQAANG